MRILDTLTRDDFEMLLTHWPFWSHVYQDPPKGAWWLWLLLGGRGAGKTRAGAEWVNEEAASGRAGRIGIIGETLHDARGVMVEGVSGVLNPMRAGMRPSFAPALRRLSWPNGAVGEIFSAEDPDQLRGPQFDLIWADEFAKWRQAESALAMAQMALRLGTAPRMLVTTTPRNVAPLKGLIGAPGTVQTRATTRDNAGALATPFIRQMERLYGGSRLGRQELMGEILEDDDTALWRRRWIDAGRVRAAPELERVVVAVDPPVTGTKRSDACGIVVAGRDAAGEIYVLADRTVQGLSPAGWAQVVRDTAAAFEAGTIVAETNQGGDLVTQLLRQAGTSALRVKAVRAQVGKVTRAEPVSVLYEQGRVHHVGTLSKLEDEMCLFGGADAGARSPDRVDALVWAVTELMPAREATARLRVL